MLGFSTIVLLIIAWNAGGWWWLFAILMSMVWLGKQQEKEKSSPTRQKPDKPPLQTTVKPPPRYVSRLQEPGCAGDDWVRKLTGICARYSASDFYVAELIPEQKLKSALASYPLQDEQDSQVIALIDTTLMGSASNGMLIHEHGLSWKNWVLPSELTSLTWEEFEELAITVVGTTIRFGNDGVFEVAGSTLGTKKTLALLTEIGELVESWTAPKAKERWTAPIVKESEAPATISAGETPQYPFAEPDRLSKRGRVDINCAAYEDLLSLPGIGAAEAKMIIKRRDSLPFSSVTSLSDFLGLRPHMADQLGRRVMFSKPHLPIVEASPSPQAGPHGSPASIPTPAPSKPSSGGRVID